MKQALDLYLEHLYTDYTKGRPAENCLDGMTVRYKEGLKYTETKLYFKVSSATSVHSFIVKEDGDKFKKGDILKAASWKVPAKNFLRGNVLVEGSYSNVSWAGA
jgi:hypothetical protein